MKWIKSTDLRNWAPQRDCQENLPLLIRKLIRATSAQIDNILFPAGDSVVYGGWDGVLESSIATEYIPNGTSLWEFGTEGTVSKKANKDYEKRKKNSLGYDPAQSTFVFVTPHHWSNKTKWIKEKQKEKHWKNILVYDSEYLEEWIEQAPAVGSWLAKYLNIYPEGVRSVEDFWLEWINNPKHTIPPKLVTAGREVESKAIEHWFLNAPSLLQMKASSREEALAFLCATIQQLEWQQRETILSRSLLVEDEKSFRAILSTRSPLLLVPYFGDTTAINMAVDKGHHVFNPVGADRTSISGITTLPRINRDGFITSLVDMGFTEDEARKYSKESGRSLSVFRRRLQYDYNQPKWARRETARTLIPLLLVGRWNENYLGDKEALSELTDQSYNHFIAELQAWTIEPDSPVYKVGNKWRLVSPIDAWSALAPFITYEDINKFEQLISKSLLEEDEYVESEFKLSPLGTHVRKANHYSSWLKEGICNSLIIISVFGQDYQLNAIDNHQSWSDKIVQKILKGINNDTLLSINRLLPALAEASPNSFLCSIEARLENTEKISKIFNIDSYVLFSNHHHTSLLFALELLAWDTIYLSRVSMILLTLATLDPGVKIANTPLNSLHYIFLPWCPQTYATYEDKISIIHLLFNKENNKAWEFLASLLPKAHDSGWLTTKPRWRQAQDVVETAVTYHELYQFYNIVVNILLKYINSDGKRLATIIKHIGSLPPINRDEIIKFSLDQKNVTSNTEDLTNEIRHILNHHRAFPDTDWVLPTEELNSLEKAYNLYLDTDDTIKYSWLFSSEWPSLIGEYSNKLRNDDYYFLQLTAQRVRCIQTLYAKGSISSIIDFSKKTNLPFYVGVSTAYINLSIEEEDKILHSLTDSDENVLSFERGYIAEKSRLYGEEWIIKSLARLNENESTVNLMNFLLFITYDNVKLWNIVNTLEEEKLIDQFWQKHRVKVYSSSEEEKVYAFKQLLKYKRYRTALHFSTMMKEALPSDLLYEILEKMATDSASPYDAETFDSHDVETIFDHLLESKEIDEHRLAGIEWLYINILDRRDETRLLHKALAGEPELFKQVLTFICKPSAESGIIEEIREDEMDFVRSRALSAYSLLTSWNIVPGTKEDGEIDSSILAKWVSETRALCLSVGRLGQADNYIGGVFGRSRPYNNFWPQEAICNIIQESRSREMESGFDTAIYNKRGVFTKSIAEGGLQEKQLSNQYKTYAKQTLLHWPRVSVILDNVAKMYESRANEEDTEALELDLED